MDSASIGFDVREGGSLAIGGSRELKPGMSGYLGQLALRLANSGLGLVCGCAKGADAAVISECSGLPCLSVMSAFGPDGAGAWMGSAVPQVVTHASAGGRVSWLAGGPEFMPLTQRLRERTRAVAERATVGALVALSIPQSHGSLLLARTVAWRGLPVVAICFGFDYRMLPQLGRGRWQLNTPALPGVHVARWDNEPGLL